MITVKPIEEKSEQERFCALCHIPFQTELLAYGAWNDAGDFTGICQFSMDAAGGHLYHLATPTANDPDDALFVLGRTALNFIDLCSVKLAFFDGDPQGRETLLQRIGFDPDETGRYSISLEGFFDHPCRCHAH